MSTTQHALTGTLRDDGTVVLDAKPDVPPGRVRLWIEGEAEPRAEEDVLSGPERAERFRAFLAELRAGQQARGYKPRSAEEIDAEINAFRDEAEEQLRELDELQAAGRSEAPS